MQNKSQLPTLPPIMKSGISPGLHNRLCKTILRCGSFKNHEQLLDIFSEERIHPWRNKIPYRDTPEKLVKALIAFLFGQTHTEGENALVLFLEVLRDNIDPCDQCHNDLNQLAFEVKNMLSQKANSEKMLSEEQETKIKEDRDGIPSNGPPIPLRAWALLLLIAFDLFMIGFWGWCLIGHNPNLMSYLDVAGELLLGVPLTLLAFFLIARRLVILDDALYCLGTSPRWLRIIIVMTLVCLVFSSLFWPLGVIGKCGKHRDSVELTPTPTPTETTMFTYQVKVQESNTGEFIQGARVTISVGGLALLDNVTDSDGLAMISVPNAYAGKLALLTVEATEYKTHTQNINLDVGALPKAVQLDLKSN